MKKLLFIAFASAPLAWLGCSDAPPVSSQSVDDAGPSGDSSDSSSRDGATKDGASKDGAITDGSADADDGFTGPPPPPPVCGTSSTWLPGTVLAVSTSDDDILDAVTSDELSIAWTRSAGSKTIYYADRAAATDAFGTPQNLGAGNFTVDRVALSPDGLTMVVVDADQLGFSELTRAARGDAFGAAATGAFSNIDSDTPSGSMVGDPVVDSSNTTFYYSLYGNGATKTVFRAVRLTPGDPWGFGFALSAGSELEAPSDAYRVRPSGVSSDDRTLYYFDQFAGIERAVWVNTTTGSYDTFVDLGARLWA
ncbi:MAG: hypothetical protein ACREJX_07330, partial [Polyangiaceae bacterium]